ncbi:MAG: hypothetical protein ACR9NN_21245 [Nostochopsis sp.]
MSQADFEKAKQRLAQAKQDILWALNVLDDAAKNLSDYKLTPEEVVQLGYQFQRDLQDIRKTLEQKTDLEKDSKLPITRYPVPPANPGASAPPIIGASREISPRITGEIPPFGDPDEDSKLPDDMGASRSIF